MVKVRRGSTGASLSNPNNVPVDTPKSRGQDNKKAREPRHEGPALAPASAARALGAVLADHMLRKASGYVPDPATGYTDVAAQTLNIIDALGLKIPGFVTVVAPNGGGIFHIPRDQWDIWQGELYQAKLRRVRRRDMERGEVLTEEEVVRLASTRIEDDVVLRENVSEWIERLRAGAETWEEEDEDQKL